MSTAQKFPLRLRHQLDHCRGKTVHTLLVSAAILLATGLGLGYYLSTQSIGQLLVENRKLRAAVENLTEESSVAVLRVLDRRVDDQGLTATQLRFSELDTKNPRVVIRETETTVEGDLIYLEGMVVIFDTEWVQHGRERALLVWRRLFDDKTAPENGIELNPIGPVPDRYLNWLGTGRSADQANQAIWGQLWDLAYDASRLQRYGIRAIQGQAAILKLEPGKLYRLQLTASGQIIAEVEPEF